MREAGEAPRGLARARVSKDDDASHVAILLDTGTANKAVSFIPEGMTISDRNPGKSGHPGRREIAMKNLILCSTLALCACAASAKTMRQPEPLAGEWKGVLVKGDTRTKADIEFTGREPRVTFWGSEITPIAPEDVGRPASPPALAHGRAVHFEVPHAGKFDGVVDGDKMEGTFTDATGSGTLSLEKEPAWDDPRYAP
jgi:hypothetical protein